MISREEYERVISTFLVELNHILLHTRAESLQTLPKFGSELGQYLADLRGPGLDPAQTLYTAFGLVDEFIDADRERILTVGFEAHQLGESNRPRSEA
jgi:hypothetical protein